MDEIWQSTKSSKHDKYSKWRQVPKTYFCETRHWHLAGSSSSFRARLETKYVWTIPTSRYCSLQAMVYVWYAQDGGTMTLDSFADLTNLRRLAILAPTKQKTARHVELSPRLSSELVHILLNVFDTVWLSCRMHLDLFWHPQILQKTKFALKSIP